MKKKKKEEEEEEKKKKKKKKSANPTYCVLKNVFLDVTPCDLVEIYLRFRGAAGHSENSVKYIPQYTASHSRRQSLFTATPSEPRTGRPILALQRHQHLSHSGPYIETCTAHVH